MNISINIYNDCTSDEPTKTYTVKRILLKTAKEIDAIARESKTKDDAEQMELVLKYLKAIFPNFEDADLDGVDPFEFGKFMAQIRNAISGVAENAQKN